MSDDQREQQTQGTLEQSGGNLSGNIINATKQSNIKLPASNEERFRAKIGALTEQGDVKINTQNNNFIFQSTAVSVEIANNVPRRSIAEFVGRERLLEELHQLLSSRERPANIALCGTGGIGKTEIALRYAQNYAEQYPGGICWLSCRDTDIRTQLLNFARSYLGIEFSKESDSENQLDICWSQWRKGDVLIIFDDVPNVDEIRFFLPPAHLRFKVLITTRQSYGRYSFKFISIDVLEAAAALQLLKSFIGEADPRIEQDLECAKELCQWLDYLPLGLELVGRYLERRQDVTIVRMFERLQAEKLTQESIQEEGIVAALELSWKELSPSAQELGYVLSLFALAPIPWWMLESVQPDVQPEELEKWRDDELRKFSLLQRQEIGIYQFHHLTREFIQSKLNEIENAEDLRKAFCRNLVHLAQNLLANEVPEGAKETPTVLLLVHIEEMVSVSPHLMEADELFVIYQMLVHVYIGQGFYAKAALWAERCKAESSIIEKPELAALNIYYLAQIYVNQSRYEEAEQLYTEALAICEQTFSQEDYTAISAGVLSELGSVRAARGKFEQAQEDCQKAIDLQKELNGSESPLVASSLFDLAEVCRIRGRYDEAETYYVEAFAIYSTVIDVEGYDNINPFYIAKGFINVSVLLLEQGQNEGCEYFSEQALEIIEAVFGRDHPYYATCLTNLAGACLNRGEHQTAEERCREAIAINEEKNNFGHPAYAISLQNMAAIYTVQGRFDEAITYYRRTLEVRQQIFGLEHVLVAEILVRLAMVYLAQDRSQEAETILTEGQTMYRATLGSAHPKYGEVLCELANVRANQEQYDEAEQLLRDAIQVFRAAYGDKHPKICEKQVILGCVLVVQERYDEANLLFNEAKDIAQDIYGKDDPNVCEYILFIAEFNYKHGNDEAADRLYAEAIGIYEQGRSKKISPDFSQGLMTLIELYEAQGRFQEVEAIYGRLIDITRRLMGNSNINLALLLARLAKLKVEGLHHEAAVELYQESLEIRQRLFSDKHPLIATTMVNLAYTYESLRRFEEAKELYIQALEIRMHEYGNSHPQVNLVKNALAGLDYARSTKSLPSRITAQDTVRVPKIAALQSQNDEKPEQKVEEATEQLKSEIEEIKALEKRKQELESKLSQAEQQKEELESQLLKLENQQQQIETLIQQHQQKSQRDQTNLEIIAQQCFQFTIAERAKLTEPLASVLTNLEQQKQEYQQTWDKLQTVIQHFNAYQEETDEILFQLNAHYQIDQTLSQLLPLDRQKADQLLQTVREQLSELDRILSQARSQHERSQQKTILRFE